jgi:type I restriction-modification system specificity subunit
MEYVKLGDICTKVCSGGTPTSSNPAYYDGNIPWLNTNEVNFCNIYSTNKTISEEGLKKSAAKYVPENTVIVAMYGVTAGKCAIAKIPLTTNQACCNLIIDKEKADYCYVYYYLRQQSDSLNKLAIGGAQQNLNALTIKKFKIALPTLPTQKKIASILSAYDRLIENNTRRIRLLEQMAENIYKEWFVRFRFPEHEKVEMVNGLPKGWKIKRYEEELNIRYGKGLSTEQLKEEGYPVFGSNGQIGFYDSYMYDNPQILISCRGASSGIVNISLPKSFITSNSLICERTEKTESLYEYLKYYFLNNNLVQYQTGSAQPQITINNIVKLKLLVPELKVQRSFSEKIRVIDMEIYNLQSQIQLLTRQRDLLLPRLMSGKLEVKS